ncbi:type IV secretion system protein VirB10 [Paraburkholderia sabiae]|uniref:Type IV secretion system protein VirB10 n=1 Tax=Paraburkholderia sabiae TaxID=273251 RepID=A0ABU9QQG8_9BURK|nr:type IV secretion system protein VirB10 [Paraburkholderia sabiae]WJZ75493.1 type IV secretion system protein VirB10 [Paraburkholderia sabiae]CAD6562806.1 Type IV secretion system protein virB10 [Paraburkholderia sabiae]
MSDDIRNTIEPDDPSDRRPDGASPNGINGSAEPLDRGMPALGQYRGTRPRAWWLTPLVVVLVAGAGAVWTIHTFLARHDAEAKAHRDTVQDTATQGRVFRDAPVAASAASAPVAAIAPAAVSGPVVARPPVAVQHPALARSYYDAPLLAVGSTPGASGQREGLADGLAAGGVQGNVVAAASSVAASVSGRPLATPGQGGIGAFDQALTPTATPRAHAGVLGDRSLVLAQGAKIDCAGDTAFDSTEAGMSTCTVTKNVYSDDGRVVLIERGSQINSQYRSNLSPGQKRTFILAARIETPHGVTVEIDSPAADALGRMGIDGYVDNHWRQRIGAAMLLGITQDAIGYLATRGGNSNGSVVYENTQQQGNDMATRVLDSTINILPTLTQNQGAEFTIVVARDLDFGTVYALQPEGAP